MTTHVRTTAAILALTAVPVLISAQADPRPVRTFPQFAGTWMLDEADSTGQLNITPRIPAQMTIAISPTEIAVTKEPRFGPRDRTRGAVTEVYRLDGTLTRPRDSSTGVTLDHIYQFSLVADMLALTMKTLQPGGEGAFTQVTDALAVDGDVLTLHRQLSSVTAAGEILVMQTPANNFRHTFVYHRQP